MELELISFKLCPFVQRAVITLLHKQVSHQVVYIDLNDPPDWFNEISPFGKVPVLRVGKDTTLFESAVISEYIDETTPNPLQLADPLMRALNRSWTEFGSACLVNLYDLSTAPTEEEFKKAQEALEHKFAKLEQILLGGPFFNGRALALVDTAYAPLFMRLELLNWVYPVVDLAKYPKVTHWSNTLLSLPEVQQSVVADFPVLYRAYLRQKAGYGPSVFAPE